ncbi:TonB-dependent receptor [Sphingomonas profundi]|uniref:TonB-dependent receptor n=1 Tax=Alterirhizorhabdus profundi TaxID=2681549 RepID=UPI0018D1ADDD|nr:TonB-dependent receptor [Sphingomonas profundi]
MSVSAIAMAGSAHAQTALPSGQTGTDPAVTSDVVPSATQSTPTPDTAGVSTNEGIQEIVVTAQKRSETANRIGMSITALPAIALTQKGITSPSDLAKVVPGFVASPAPRGAPVYAIRGIGFDDSTLGSASTVATYIDEVPLSYPVETRFATMDLERVEVLKGPQGILFGQNSTAGAINFIAAKPTDEFKAGFDGSYGRFNEAMGQVFVSGPLSDRLKVRISGMGTRSDGWQKSYTRDDKLGAKRQYAGRIIAMWNPVDALQLTLNVNGWRDKSDTQAAQLQNAFPLLACCGPAPYANYPHAPNNARAADWDANPLFPLRRNDSMFQSSLRADLTLAEGLVLTSISAYTRYKQNFAIDLDGANIRDFSLTDKGKVNSFNQEVRLAGDFDRLKFIVGGNYAKDKVYQYNGYFLPESSVNIGFLGNTDAASFFSQPIKDVAVFGNVDFKVTDSLTLHGGARYTKDKRIYTGCTADYGDGVQGGIFNIVYASIVGHPFNIQPGGCTSNNPVLNPNGSVKDLIPGLAVQKLNQDNVSWRAGVDYQATPTMLVYANVSRGYKSGSFPSVNVVANSQLEGVTQESVLAYEGGVKAGLFNRRLQINAAGFYNDYTDKQLRGRILDPFGFFGVLDKLLNIPKSRVYGAEISVQALPTEGLNLNVSATYVNTKVTKSFFAYDPVGNLFDYKGLAFPHTPKWNITASADYERPISNGLKGFVGANLLYQSKTIGLFADPAIISQSPLDPVNRPGVKVPGNSFDVKAFTTVDAQVGVADADGKWRAWIFGRNIFNEYYWTNATQSFDSIYRLAGMPRTYGVSVSLRY